MPLEDAPLQVALQRTLGLIHRLAAEKSPSDRLPDRPRTVTLLGGRGSGKSTLLALVHQRLVDPDLVVLPIIDPEGFAEGDSLIGWVLAHLERVLTDDDRSFILDEASEPLGVQLQTLMRWHAVHRSGFIPGLEAGGLSFEDFGRDAVKMPSVGVRLAERLSDLVNLVAKARGADDLRIVIMVDDADLSPHHLPSIVEDAQLLSATGRVVNVFAADEALLRRALLIGLLGRHVHSDAIISAGFVDRGSFTDIVGRQLVKYFPRSLRSILSDFEPQQRLRFSPLSSSASIESLLNRFLLPDGRSLGQLFSVWSQSGERVSESEYCRGLSSNARDLRQLHEVLSGIDAGGPFAAGHAIAALVEHGLDALRDMVADDVVSSIRFDYTEPQPGVLFDFRGIHFGKRSHHVAFIYTADDASTLGPEHDVAIRVVETHYAHTGQVDSEDGAAARRRFLPESYAYLAALAWETADRSDGLAGALRTRGLYSTIAKPGGANWRNAVGSLAPGSNYWTVPIWEGFSDYFTYSVGWARVVQALDGIQLLPGEVQGLEFAWLAHLRLVCSVQESRAIPDDLAVLEGSALQRTLKGAWLEARDQTWSETATSLRAIWVKSQNSKAIRDADYVAWVEGLLPLSASVLFAPKDLAERLLDLWEELVPLNRREAASAMVTQLAQDHLDEASWDADVDLLGRVDGEAATRMKALRVAVGERSNAERARVLQALSAFGVPEAVLAQLESTGLTADVGKSLLVSGVRGDALGAAARAFPSKVATGGERSDQGSADGEF